MTRRINTLLLMLLMLVVSSRAYALDDNERAILQRVGISADDGALYINDEGHIYSVDLSARGLKTIPFPLLELPYVVDINLSSNPFNGQSKYYRPEENAHIICVGNGIYRIYDYVHQEITQDFTETSGRTLFRNTLCKHHGLRKCKACNDCNKSGNQCCDQI